MPTGYTAPVQDNPDLTLEDFAFGCARNFGALYFMRDSPIDAPVPERLEPSPYYAKHLAEAEAKLDSLLSMPSGEAEDAAEADYKERVAIRESCEANRETSRLRYERMKKQISDWMPPSPQHQGLKDFMYEQLSESIRFDCSIYPQPPIERESGRFWRARRIAEARDQVISAAQSLREEVKRTDERNDWIKALRESFANFNDAAVPQPVPSAQEATSAF